MVFEYCLVNEQQTKRLVVSCTGQVGVGAVHGILECRQAIHCAKLEHKVQFCQVRVVTYSSFVVVALFVWLQWKVLPPRLVQRQTS